jgi:hypothetical protein
VDDRTSHLLLEEYFSTGDERFMEALRAFHVPGRLATLADRWKKDPRPWARDQIFRYLDLPLDCPAHETVVKRLFKHAEEKRDDELMGAFAAAFDRLIRRRVATRWRYDYRSRQSWSEQHLRSPYDSLATPAPGAPDGPIIPQWVSFARLASPKKRLFSYHTRQYLRRRAWRYFRRTGHGRPHEYAAAVARMLRRYRDEDFARGENILDCWGLLHACFHESEVLEFGASTIKVREGRGLRELLPAPQFPSLWKEPSAANVLLDLLVEARARLVRVWATQLLRRDHADRLKNISVKDLRRLLDHDDDEVQMLGAELLEGAIDLDKLPVPTWVELLGTRNLTALETIARLMARYVRADRIDLEQAVALAVSAPAPVARLGLEFLQGREVRTEADRETVAMLASARSAAVGLQAACWALQRLGAPEAYDAGRVARFFDSLLREVREGAWEWLAPGVRGWDDPALWSRLTETPYDDVRLHLVKALERRTSAPGLGPQHLAGVWCSVLLAVHRGGRHKLIALRQISDAFRNNPASAERLLPVLAVAIRSVRPPEARAGLAAIVSAVEARPELAGLVSVHLPELRLLPEGATA